MHQIPTDSVASWATQSSGGRSFAYPMAAPDTCPHCGRTVLFSFEQLVTANNFEHEMPIKVLCPGCRSMVRFFIIDPGPESGDSWSGELWMHPTLPRPRRRAVEGLIPDQILTAYNEALESYGHGMWRPAAQGARVVLEGMVKAQLADIASDQSAKQPLAAQLATLAARIDLARPINDVAEVLKDGGNVASHFDEALSVTPEMAAEMLELLGTFIDYTLLTPKAVRRLREQLTD
jgi:hypothetical protein